MATIRVRGQFSVNVRQIDKKLAQLHEMELITEKYVNHAVELAQSYVRVDTGKLRDSIAATVKREANSIIWEITAGKGIRDQRAAANEYGTEYMDAQPYLRPAMEQIREPLRAELEAVWKS